jgi:hypothetical protein
MLHEEIKNELNIFLKNYLNLSYKPLYEKVRNVYILQGTSYAMNFRRNDQEEVKVLHWFNDFYIYLEVKFLELYAHKMISISIFQGEDNDKKKNQLFRAEWDDYNKDVESRPQPHWHITRDNAIYDRFSDFTNHEDEKEKIGFENFDVVQAEVFDTKKIHFAMSGNWHNNISPVHKIDDASKVVAWMQGLLEHIKYELKN